MADEAVRVGFDPNKLKFREMKVFEQIAGVPVGALQAGTVLTSGMLVAMVYIEMVRNDPSITVDDVWEMDIDGVDFSDPTQAAPTPLIPMDKPATTKRTKAS